MPAPKPPIRIQTAAYDEESKRLVVTFSDGKRVERENVSQSLFDRLMKADGNPKVSTLAYFQKYFKTTKK